MEIKEKREMKKHESGVTLIWAIPNSPIHRGPKFFLYFTKENHHFYNKIFSTIFPVLASARTTGKKGKKEKTNMKKKENRRNKRQQQNEKK